MNCFFSGYYTLERDTEKLCTFFEKKVDKVICSKCPYFINDYEARKLVKRYVQEAKTKTK